MRIQAFLLLCATVLISACTGQPVNSGHDWIDGQSKRYPPALYLIGQGMADNLNDAKDRARADLAKQFEVAINDHSLQQQQYDKQQQGDQNIEKLQQSVMRRLSTQTTRTIQGIEIADSWHDETNHRHHALAVLSRNKAKHQFEQQISALDEQSQQKLKQADTENNPLRKTGLIQQSIDAQLQRINVQSTLQVADPSGRGNPASISLAELIRTRDTLIGNITIAPMAEGPLTQKLKPIISGNTANAGFQVSTAEHADYILVADTKLDPPFQQNNWHWLRGTLELRLVGHNNNDIGIKRWPIKAASIAAEQAEQRLLSDINTLLKDELRQTVLAFGGAE